MFTISDFKVESGAYVRALSRMYFGRNWLWFLVPVVACAVPAMWLADVRWLIVGLMLAMMVYPMILVLLYINYALTQESRWSIMEKTATFSSEGIGLTFTDPRMREHIIAWRDIDRVERDDCHIFFHLRARKYTFFMLPRIIFAQQDISETQLLKYVRSQLGRE